MNNKNKKEDLITQEEITHFFNSIDAIFIKLNKNTLEVTYISNQVEDILGYEIEEIIKDKNWFIKNIHTDDRNKVIEELRILTIFNIPNTIFFRFRNKNGKYLILKTYLIAYKDYIFSLLFDITFEKEQEEKLCNSHIIINNIYKSIPQGILLINTNNFKIIEYKPTKVTEIEICTALGIEINKSIKEIFPNELFNQIVYFIDRTRILGTIEKIEIKLNILNKEKFFLFTLSKVSNNEILIVIDDITQIKENEEKLRYLALHDPLTGLPNRKYLFEQLSQLIIQANRHNRKLAIIFLDIDNFKDINDSYGHEIGDKVLLAIAETIKYHLRPGDIIGRIGGDEFIIILDDIAKIEDINIIANKINKAIENIPNYIKSKLGIDIFKVTFSMGISIFPDDSTDINEVIKFADTALYKAKELGKNTFCFYSQEITNKLEKRLKMLKKINEAIKNKEFVNYYQPIIDISKINLDEIDFNKDIVNITLDSVIGFESLIRWIDKDNNFISPLEFIPLAEETNLIIDIGKIVLNNGMSDFNELKRIINKEFIIFFNISPKEFENPSFKDDLFNLINSNNFNFNNISLEITENLIIKNFQKFNEILEELIKNGIWICIDDFGTGYSSLSYLVNLNVNIVKIDRFFIKNIGINPKDEQIIKIIIEISHSLGLKVVGEGVETLKQLEFLKFIGCDYAQGFLFAKPMPLNQLIYFLSNLEN
jgi:diguanylate cyclase (GGDEF)-like protein/PAS domain S-box-containing protein